MRLKLAYFLLGLVVSTCISMPALATDIEMSRKADDVFAAALSSYKQGDIATAILGFQRVYSLTGDRTLLFNVARCHEKLGSNKTAAQWYRAYLSTKPVDMTTIEAKIAELAPNAKLNTKSDGELAARRPEELQSIGRRWLKWGLAGLSGAGLVTAVGLGLDASDASQRADNATDAIATKQWEDYADEQSRASRYLALFTVVTGGLAVYMIVTDGLESQSRVDVAPSPGGAVFNYSVDF
ncbi:MAG: tetratricopeptide repeat protein [Bradymonadia bacterium]